MDWAQEPQNLRLLMWIYGPAGAGKTAIMQTIAEICEEAGILGASFFFFRTDNMRNVKGRLVATLAYQLALKQPKLGQYITSAINRDPSIFSQSLAVQMQVLIVTPMVTFLDTHPHVTNWRHIILVDGLDECSPENCHREIITVLSQNSFPPFRFIIASRPEYAIRNTFSLPYINERTETLALDDNYQPDGDIDLFLRDKFNELRFNHPRGPHLPPHWPGDANINTLIRNASGQFIYAATAMKFLDSPRHDPIKALDTVLRTQISADQLRTPFAQLDALYHHVLNSVQEIYKVLGILHCLLLVHDIGDIDGVEALLAYSHGESRTVLCDMHSLLGVPGSNNGKITFYHTSLGDFLRDRLRARHLYVPPIDSRQFIATCFAQNFRGVFPIFPRDLILELF